MYSDGISQDPELWILYFDVPLIMAVINIR
jgi:hypothetical protein